MIDNHVQVDGVLMVPIGAVGVVFDGASTGWLSPLAPYAGTVLAIGPPLATAIAGSHRPASVLDVTAASGRTGVATLGTHSLLTSSDAITLGCVAGGLPTYYVLDALTIDVCFIHPATTPAGTGILGFSDGTTADPWEFYIAGDTSTLGFAYQLATGGEQAATLAYDQTLPKNRISVQMDFVAGHLWVFRNGTRVVNTTFTPGLRFRPQSGLTPFGIGFANTFAPVGAAPANLTVDGCKISAGLRYADNNTQTLLTAATLDDTAFYFVPAGGDPPVIAYLPLNDTAAAPTVQVNYGNGTTGIAYWSPSTRSGFASDTVIKDLKITGNNLAPAVSTGDSLYATFRYSQFFSGTVGINSLASSASEDYTVEIVSCRLGGCDSSVTFQDLIFDLNGTTKVVGTGDTFFRLSNCDTGIHGRTFFPGPGSTQRLFYDVRGGLFRDQGINTIDDENGEPSSLLAGYQFTQGINAPGSFSCQHVDRSIGTHPYFRFVGLGTGAGWSTPMIDVSDLTSFGGVGGGEVVVQFVGLDVFRGLIDLRGLNVGPSAVSGTTSVKVIDVTTVDDDIVQIFGAEG